MAVRSVLVFLFITFLTHVFGSKLVQEPETTARNYHLHCCCNTDNEKAIKETIGSSVNKPGKSCVDILNKGGSFGDGEYWIKPLSAGAPFIAYCDMTTDNGGWTLVSSFVLHGKSPFSFSISTDYKDIEKYKSDKLAITDSALGNLRVAMGFSQLRFNCYKKITGRTFHVMTKKNVPLGEAVVQYFSGQTKVLPKACGSFDIVPGDNSKMAQECSRWGYSTQKKYYSDFWSHHGLETSASKLTNHAAFVGSKYHWIVTNGNGRWECDDYSQNNLNPGDYWKIFVR